MIYPAQVYLFLMVEEQSVDACFLFMLLVEKSQDIHFSRETLGAGHAICKQAVLKFVDKRHMGFERVPIFIRQDLNGRDRDFFLESISLSFLVTRTTVFFDPDRWSNRHQRYFHPNLLNACF